MEEKYTSLVNPDGTYTEAGEIVETRLRAALGLLLGSVFTGDYGNTPPPPLQDVYYILDTIIHSTEFESLQAFEIFREWVMERGTAKVPSEFNPKFGEWVEEYQTLIRRQFMGESLTPQELGKIKELEALMDAEDEQFYAPILKRLEDLVKKVKEREKENEISGA